MPGDGHCLLHALCLAFYPPYILSTKNGVRTSRVQVVRTMRQELATALTQTSPNGYDTFYSYLYDGNLQRNAGEVRDYSLSVMHNELRSSTFLGNGYLQLISDTINKDIYVLDAASHELYPSSELRYSCRGNRASIIVLYHKHNAHFSLIGVDEMQLDGKGSLVKTGNIRALLSCNHSLIQSLQAQVKALI